MSSVYRDETKPLLPTPRKSYLQGYITSGSLDMPPHLHNFALIFFPFYLSLIPVAKALTRPTGYFSILLDKVWGPRDAKSIAVLIGLGYFNTYLLSATGSVYAQSMHPGGYQNQTPRLVKEQLRGVAHRLVSQHQSLIEIFPGFGITALLVLTTHLTGVNKNTSLIDGLFLHFLLKHIIFPIAYIAGDDFNRSGAHVFSISTLLSVLYECISAL